MPKKRNKENQGLPKRWRFTRNAYYYQVPPGLEHLWDGKKTFKLGNTLTEAYKIWADRLEVIIDTDNKQDLIAELEQDFKDAADTERRLSAGDKKYLHYKCNWPDYLYTPKERAGWCEPERARIRPTAADISHLDKMIKLLNKLGTRRDKRTVSGKKIIWLRACGLSYRQIASVVGVPPTTCEFWYKQDMGRLAR